ncbi:MAG: hypothetical protein ACI8PZ_000076 [Myxococcota bacterium]|jgi:hypothetical protein
MGQLTSDDDRRVALSPYLVVGRSRRSDLTLPNPRVSGSHAAIRWSGDRWTVRDLGSRNGTWVNGARLAPGEEASLVEGARIGFGRPEGEWTLIDSGPPVAHAVCGDRVVVADGEGSLGIPPDDPAAWVYRVGAAWRLEREGDVHDARDGDAIVVGEHTWRLALPEPLGSTLAQGATPAALCDVVLVFHVSSDEEHVELEVQRGAAVDKFKHRAHHYLLLTLARLRAEEHAAGVDEADAGWVYQDDLSHQLRLGTNGLYQQIHRSRRQLRGVGVGDSERVVERRSGSGQLRIGTANVEFHKG